MRDKSYDGETYKKRSVCEGFVGALTNWFGEDVPCSLDNTTTILYKSINRIDTLRLVVYLI